MTLYQNILISNRIKAEFRGAMGIPPSESEYEYEYESGLDDGISEFSYFACECGGLGLT